jgi:hypothetical protein
VKRSASRYGAGERDWIKAKNPRYWRREFEIEAIRRSRERRSARPFVSKTKTSQHSLDEEEAS